MYKVAWSRVKSHQSPRLPWASCKQEPMESMALVPPTPLALAYVGVFLIKSEYIKQNQSKNLFTATCQASVGEACMWKKSRGGKKSQKLKVSMKTKPWENKDDTKQKKGYRGVSVMCCAKNKIKQIKPISPHVFIQWFKKKRRECAKLLERRSRCCWSRKLYFKENDLWIRKLWFMPALWHISAHTHWKCFTLHCCICASWSPATFWRSRKPFVILLSWCNNFR